MSVYTFGGFLLSILQDGITLCKIHILFFKLYEGQGFGRGDIFYWINCVAGIKLDKLSFSGLGREQLLCIPLLSKVMLKIEVVSVLSLFFPDYFPHIFYAAGHFY